MTVAEVLELLKAAPPDIELTIEGGCIGLDGELTYTHDSTGTLVAVLS